MTDSATRAADPARAEVLRYRAGEPTRGPLLWEAGLWETPAQALEALRSGAWVPVECEHPIFVHADVGEVPCSLQGGGAVCGPKVASIWTDCPVCMGTGKEWSPKHAELAAYAGEESLRGACSLAYLAGLREELPLKFTKHLPHYGPVPPVVAAYGVVREWLREGTHCEDCGGRGFHMWDECEHGAYNADGCCDEGEKCDGTGVDRNRNRRAWDALDAVERWIWEPSEANRLACRDPWTFATDGSPHSLLAGGVYWPELGLEPIETCLALGLLEDQAAQAARAWVRRWALAPLVGR